MLVCDCVVRANLGPNYPVFLSGLSLCSVRVGTVPESCHNLSREEERGGAGRGGEERRGEERGGDTSNITVKKWVFTYSSH